MGPGRGSGAGSLVAYALTITDLDPFRFNLLFERFLNPERVSMPDFDIDFCQDRRDEVIAYVQQRYGADRVAQIITFGKLQARMVTRDVGRVLQMPYGQVDRLSKLIPNNPANPVTLQQAIDGEPKLQEERDQDPTVRTLFDIALKLEGLYRNASTHAAGVVIGDRPLRRTGAALPRSALDDSGHPVQHEVCREGRAGEVRLPRTQDADGDREGAEAHPRARARLRYRPAFPTTTRRPTRCWAMATRWACSSWKARACAMCCARCVPTASRTSSPSSRSTARARWTTSRASSPARRAKSSRIICIRCCEPILKETYGIIVYQEQVMQIAQILSGYSLGEADLLRRAMGKKIKSEMDAQKERFITGAAEKGIDADQADYIFELVARNSPATASTSRTPLPMRVVAYQTAYLKANYPVEFLAASMTLDMGNTDKLMLFRREAQRIGVKVIPPSINASGVDFAVMDGAILYSLAALKNVGAGAIEHLVAVREEGGPFRSLGDFARRIDARVLNKRALESLAKAGAFDGLNPNRAQVLDAVESILSMANRTSSAAEAGQNDLFGGAARARRTIWCCRAAMPGCRWTSWRRSSRRLASISPAIRSTIT